MEFGALFAGFQVAVEEALDGAQALVHGFPGEAAAAGGGGLVAGRVEVVAQGRQQVGAVPGVVVDEPARAAVRRTPGSGCPRGGRTAGGAGRCRTARGRTGPAGGAGRAGWPRRRGPPRGRSGRCRRGPRPPSRRSRPLAGPGPARCGSVVRPMGRQGWEGRRASRMPRRPGASSPTRAGTPAVRSSWDRRVSGSASSSARAEVHQDRDEPASVGRQAQRGAAGAGVLGGAVALFDQVAQGVSVGGAFPGGGVDEAGDGQGHRGPLQHGDVLRPEGAGPSVRAGSMTTRPQRSPWYSTGAVSQPSGPHAAVWSPGRGGSGALFPVGERLLHRAAGGLADQRLVHQVLQDDRAAAHLRRRAHHVLRARHRAGSGR